MLPLSVPWDRMGYAERCHSGEKLGKGEFKFDLFPTLVLFETDSVAGALWVFRGINTGREQYAERLG